MDGSAAASRFTPSMLPLALLPFVFLCTLNSGTYRYGASDQAFYQPAVALAMHPDAFPHDAPVIKAQAELTLMDEAVGTLSSITGAPLPPLFAALYVAALVLLAIATWLIASRLYQSPWTGVALLAALTLRHQISRSGTNTLEGYFHPRQVAFGLGALALALLLRRRRTGVVVALLLAAAVHPTTAMWFGIWLGVATLVMEPRFRRGLIVAALLSGIAAVWALTSGPLAGRLVVMDPEWLATLETKTYLFPLDWPVTAWLANLGYIPVIVGVYYWRRQADLKVGLYHRNHQADLKVGLHPADDRTDAAESGLVVGALALVAVFTALLPFNAAHVALAVQLQPARVFWMLDFFATIYLVWAVAEAPWHTATRRGADLVTSARASLTRLAPQGDRRRAVIAVVVITAVSLARGGYGRLVSSPERAVAQIDIKDDDWGRVMTWARTTDVRSGFLADPMHAVLYGTSVRVAAGRDVMVEAVKDAAIGMYDRRIAIRTRDRLAAIGDFGSLTPDRARSLAASYELDYLVTEHPIDLPLAFESGRLKIYRLR